ncbi:MAG: InlB B-repeat-containing protein, partial [Paludibacteraceae bacterium]|nr:InlB B-repeat-containing protein [Paludibacteraceae bacterium]
VTITKHGAEYDYDGTAKLVSGYDFASDNELFVRGDLKFIGEETDSIATGTVVGKYGMTFTKDDFENLNKNFSEVNITIVEDSLVINPITVNVTITKHGAEYNYDGIEKSVSGYDFDSETDLYVRGDLKFIGEVADSIATGTDAGKYGMAFTKDDFENLNKNFSEVNITVVEDSLVITPRENVIVTITKHSDSVTYNGEEHTVTGYDFDSNDQLYIESYMRFNGEVSDSIAKGTNVGSYGMSFDETFFENINNNFKDVKFVVNSDDSLTIIPLHIIVDITGHVDTVTYNAQAHSVYGYEWNASDGLYNTADYFTYAGDSVAVGTDVKTYEMGLTIEQFTNTNNNFDVEFNVMDGWLTIKPLDVLVNITGHTNTVIYNGSEQTVYGYDWNATDDLYDNSDYFTYAGDSVAKGMTVGTYPMGLEAGQFNNTNNNFNVTFKVTDGWLTINRLDVIVDITGHVDTRTYNGEAQYVYGYDWNANTDLYTESDFRHVNDSVATGTTIGTYPMGLEVGQFTNVNENFTVSFNLVSDGLLTINKITTPITITALSGTMVYDGGEMTVDEFSFTRNILVEGDILYADVEGAITNVGTVPNVVTGYRVLRGTVDVTENYTFNPSVNGALTVTRRPVTIESATDEKTYDGTPLTNNTITVTPTATGEGFVRGEGARYNVTGSITEIGSVDNTFTFTPLSNTDTANYTITVKYGKLTINKIETPIAITANSNSKMYDGKPLTDAGFTFTEGVLAEGDELQADVVGSITDFGTATNKVTGYKVVRGDLDVTKNYTFGDMVDGTLSITKRSVTITSASGTKVYDRTPLTNGVVSVSGDGFADFEGALFYVTGTITEYGRVANVFTYELKSNTKADNYVIDTVYGTLSITKRPTAIVYNYGYDNKADTVSGFADEPYTQMADPVRTGYDFKGWDGELPILLPLDTLTVTAQWNLITYEIQLDTFETITYTVEDHKVIDLNDYIPYYEGHDFMGWRDNNGNIVETISTDDASSVDLTATWHIATYYITYISNGKTLKTVPVVFADPIPAIADPVREGYTFSGWSPAIPETMPEGGLTVTAQWGLVTYKLTLEDEGNVVGVYEYTVEDEFFFIDKIEDREGMRFDGWTLNGVLLDYDRNEDKYIFFPALIADNVSISAKWTTVTNEFNLIYKVDGVTYQNFVVNAGESTAAYVASVLDPADKRGYKFNGWDMDVPEVMPRRDMVINAVWKPVVYYITLKDENGEELERINYTIEELVQLPTYPEKDGQVFLGWSDGLNTYYEIKPGSSAEDFELTATWGVKSFEIIYIVDGVEYARDTIQAGAPLVKISDPETTEEGYAFSGWSATPDIMPAHDLTVTGSFELGGYTLTYIIDGEVIRTSRYLYGAAISPAKAPSRMGYEFDVWEGLPATMPAHDLSVTGTYKIATYSIVLRNEGVAIDTLYYTIFDDVITLPVIDGPGKMFKGWYDGRKTVNRINPNEYSGNIDLVASWIYFNFTVTFYVDDAQYSRNNSMRYGDVIQLPEEPTKEGLYFIRWDGMPADGLMPENDLKLYAVFSDNPDDVGVDVIEDVPTVDVYTGKGEIVVLRAENMDIQVMDFDGLTIFRGISNSESFSIPVRYRGAYIVRINNQFRKVLVK